MDLKCKQLNCEFNDCYCCKAKRITVDQKAQCSSYKKDISPDKKQHQDASKNMFETAPEYSAYRHNKDVEIGCNCQQCLFNESGHCSANGISVSSGTKAKCLTVIDE